MNTLKMGPASRVVSSREGASDAFVERVVRHSRAALS